MYRLFWLSLVALVLLTACSQSREKAFYAAAARIEEALVLEWSAVIEVIGVGPSREYSFLDSEDSRSYLRWRLVNMQRHAELGRRLRPPPTVPETWVRHWDAALQAFIAQGEFAFQGINSRDPEAVARAIALCEEGWRQLARRDQQGFAER